MENIEVRQLIAKKRLKFYEIAAEIGISSFTFSVWLRTPLNDDRKKRTFEAIDRLTKK